MLKYTIYTINADIRHNTYYNRPFILRNTLFNPKYSGLLCHHQKEGQKHYRLDTT